MILSIDRHSPIPASQQILDQIKSFVAARTIKAGYQLPTIRQLARDLGVSPGTVARTYRDLDSAGITESRGRHGTFIATGAEVDRENEVTKAVREFALRVKQLGVPPNEALHRVKEALESHWV